MKAGAPLRVALLAAAAFVALAAPAHAAEIDGWGDDIEVMQDEEMGDLRGGFIVPGTTININLGAVVTTIVNGNPVLTTNVTWTDAGQIVSQTMANVGQSLSDLSPDQLSALGLDGLGGAGGIVISDEAGVTALVHNITESSIQNIIVNSATGRDLRQEVDVTLTLPGFDMIQSSLVMERIGMHISDDMLGFLD